MSIFEYTKIAQSIAFRYRRGGLFRPPEKMTEKVQDFAEKVVCQHHLAQAQENLEDIDEIEGAYYFVTEDLNDARDIDRNPDEVIPAREGEVERIPYDIDDSLEEPRYVYIEKHENRFYIGIESEYSKSEVLKGNGFDREGIRDFVFDISRDIDEKYEYARERLIDYFEESGLAGFRTMVNIKPARKQAKSIVETCQKMGYTEGERAANFGRTETFEADLSEWSYVRGREETFAEKEIQRSVEQLTDLLIDLDGSVEKADQGEDVSVEAPLIIEGGRIHTNQYVTIEETDDGRLDVRIPGPESREFDNKKEAIQFIGEYVEEKIDQLQGVLNGDIHLSAEDFLGWKTESLDVTVYPFKKDKGGSYNQGRGEIALYWDGDSKYKVKKNVKSIRRTARHEMQHYGQYILQELFDLAKPAGMPPSDMQTDPPDTDYSKDPNRQDHPKRDIEFQTRLADEATRFRQFLDGWSDMREGFVMDAFRAWTQQGDWEEMSESPSDEVALSSAYSKGESSFGTWKEENPEKYKKAIRILSDELSDILYP